MTTLRHLDWGQSAQVLSVGGTRAFRRRLLELGLVPGSQVELVRQAPLGDPLEFRVRDALLSIRGAEADQVTVAPVTVAPAEAAE